MTIKSSLSSSTAAPKATTTGGVVSYSYRALQAQNDIYLSTPTSTSHSNNDTLNTTTPHLQYHHRVLPTVTHKTVKRKDQTAGELQHRLATTQQRLASNKTKTTTNNSKTTKTTTSQQSIEAELCKTLQISWIDARDLASFARGKLNIIPGDKSQEKTRRQSILRVAIEADKAAPRKRVLSKPKKKKLTKEEETIQRLKKAENNPLIRWDIREGGRRHYGTYIY